MRRNSAPKRDLLPDPKFGDARVAKFINYLMRSGKRSLAERIVYFALEDAVEKLKKQVKDTADAGTAVTGGATAYVDFFYRVIENLRPGVEVKSRRVGGATYQVPVEVNALRGDALAMRWLIDCAKSRSEKSMARRLAAEMVEAYQGRGNAVKKREDTHRMAKANQAFAYYRW